MQESLAVQTSSLRHPERLTFIVKFDTGCRRSVCHCRRCGNFSSCTHWQEQVIAWCVAMEVLRRVIVWTCMDGAPPQMVPFLRSVTGSLGSGDQASIRWRLDQNRLLLSRDPTGILLQRPAYCPIKHLSVKEAASVPLDIQQRGVDVGVAIILESADQSVLLTRRAKHLRIFPNIWVLPGGHLEPDETLLEAGLRELKEETGLAVEAEQFPSAKFLGVWESVYPLMLSRGPPQRHHLVVYVLLRSAHTHLQLQECLRPSPAEVSACLWADARLAGASVAAVDGQDCSAAETDEPEGLPASISVSEVSPDGGLKNGALPVCVLLRRAPPRGPDVERVSAGTKFALNLWLKTLRPSTTLFHS
ncbi:nucleoside diphosphate-linked moiety X motif 17 [Hippocampus zosterae]|uniref:nucleoside diphosphate-linked moiety X motif 17 n=1 Tax=Hippocampus zosterae TaxID=109293 RepID=UPI00223DAA51|nr:nucleoside diphosphate-linked moiety X motif 17 [Hippocampus zosterae]